MARKKRKAKKTSRRRRSVGALALNASSPLVKYGSIAAGYLLADKINTPIDTAVGSKIDSKIIAAGQVGLGALLVFKKGGKPSLVKTVLGGVMLGAGAKRGMASFGIGGLGGYQSVPAIAGYQNVPAVGSARTRRLVNGMGSHGGSRVAISDASLLAAR